MGTVFVLQCKKCEYEIEGYLSIGFAFPRIYEQTMEAARAGKLSKHIQQFLQEHPDGCLNCEKVFLQCTCCGALEVGQDLSMYAPKADTPRQHGRWSAATPFDRDDYTIPWDLKENYVLIDPVGNYCSKCGKPMKSISAADLGNRVPFGELKNFKTDITCPKCKENLYIKSIGTRD